MDDHKKALDLVADLLEAGDLETADDILEKILKKDPNNAAALTNMCMVLLRWPRTTLAYQCGKRAAELAPMMFAAWINYGFAAQDLWQHKEAKRAYMRALELAKSDEDKVKVYANLSAWCVDLGLFEEGIRWSETALKINPKHDKILCNLGFCQLGLREWVPGWKNYHYSLYVDARKMVQYGDEPEWDGTPGKKVVVYGEQGIGDEVSFASMVPDAAKDCEKLVYECHAKLENLFRRSFPNVTIYGTRKEKYLGWKEEDREIDASLAVGQLGEYYRTKDEDFPGTPYLKADPDRTLMWKALWESKGKPAIGIAWRGGIPRTGAKFRTWDLSDIEPLINSIDAHWVSLQYRPSEKEIERSGLPIHEYRTATLTDDYEDTACLVNSLDMVICVQTAVAHLAGGLGKEVWVCVPKNTQWRYGNSTESIPWYNSLKVVRQTKEGRWENEIKRMAKDLRKKFPQEVLKAS